MKRLEFLRHSTGEGEVAQINSCRKVHRDLLSPLLLITKSNKHRVYIHKAEEKWGAVSKAVPKAHKGLGDDDGLISWN